MAKTPGSDQSSALDRLANMSYPRPLDGRQAALSVAVFAGKIVSERSNLQALRAGLSTPGTTVSTAAVLVNEVSQGTVSIASGDTSATTQLDVDLNADDKVELSTTVVGTSAAGLVVSADIVRRFGSD